MTIKGALLTGAALAVCAFSTSAEAANDRLSVYEINQFVTSLTNAVNNPDASVGRAFLMRNVDINANIHHTVNSTWADSRYLHHQAWYGDHRYGYYRYPYATSRYYAPTSYRKSGKMDMIRDFEVKKTRIPRYHQAMTILGTRMPADASSALIDVNLKEFGLSYALAPYGTYYGQKLQHSNASCQLSLRKVEGDVRITKMNCNTALHAPI